MPDYDYRCNACLHVFEKTQRITAPSGANCPQCDSADCTRIISGGTFHLKGSGWYASDYGAKTGVPHPSDKPPAAEKETTAEATSDAPQPTVSEKPTEKSSEPTADKPASPAEAKPN